MQQTAATRKRPAPGTSPLAQQAMQPAQPSFQDASLTYGQDFTNGFGDFNTTFTPDQSFTDPTAFTNDNIFADLTTPPHPTYNTNVIQTPSTDLVRRSRNTQLAAHPGQEQWNGGAMAPTTGQNEEEDEETLTMKVALAKKDAQGKRKSIPPFVQKLSSFLDQNHTSLIRWSDDGRSFIVLDEDEFARKLIPELFKHNNYASFVRQLNMYGFHKTVNMHDGSLRQSEKAQQGRKPPSMYSHPYFRKNRPDLLWLIQKPTGKANAKRKREGYDSDDERQFSPAPDGRPSGELGPAAGQDVALPRNELASVRQELKKLQQQQGLISRMIAQLKEQNEQFYRQATAFQALHDRHENSINAILTFLATFYNRSVEGHQGQGMMFGNNGQNNQQQHGSVVEEFNDGAIDGNTDFQQYEKKPQLLLTGPNASGSPNLGIGSSSTQPNSARQSTSPPGGGSPRKRDSTTSVTPQILKNGQYTGSPTIKTDAPTPVTVSNDNDNLTSFLDDINANNSNDPNAYNFTPSHHFGAGNNAQQTRDDVLTMLNDVSNSTSGKSPAAAGLEQVAKNDEQIQLLDRAQKHVAGSINGLERKLSHISSLSPGPGGLTYGVDENYDPFTDFTTTGNDFGNPNFDELINLDSNNDYDFLNDPLYTQAATIGEKNQTDSGADMFSTGDGLDIDSAQLGADPFGTENGRVESLASSKSNTPSEVPAEAQSDDGNAAELTSSGNKRQRRL
ncbi:heat shock transcription factor like protein [Zymoseptoria brevis]|uniref:Heat shock transcription factor like protein n=1 Tax=Zymoseptoria brevis TaxID=1047168 RepID=A0A0F4GQZ7_9PEZI|nr:heat shock transcription factor like protein [Zymoseptoria brevis]